MPYVGMSYIGWPNHWLKGETQKVNEIIIKCFVNRYFSLPEDWDDDDIPLVMIWVRCITCGYVSEHFMRETEEEWNDFLNNRDNTYTSISNPECNDCNAPPFFHNMEELQEERGRIIEEDYKYVYQSEAIERYLQFGSPIEKYFWKAWRTSVPAIFLIPQYQIGNYRVDFAYVPTKTVIELDGKPYHSTSGQVAYDQKRQTEIEQQGWRFLRFKGSDINYHVDRCIIDALRFISERDSELISYLQYEWTCSPSARVLTQLGNKYDYFIGDVP